MERLGRLIHHHVTEPSSFRTRRSQQGRRRTRRDQNILHRNLIGSWERKVIVGDGAKGKGGGLCGVYDPSRVVETEEFVT